MMTVKELINKLLELDPTQTLNVKVDDGFCDLVDIQVSRTVDININNEVIVIEPKQEDIICNGDILVAPGYDVKFTEVDE